MHHIDARSGRAREQCIGWLVIVIALSCVPVCAQAARAYVSNEDGESVTVIDIQRAEAIATIPVGKRPRGLKLNRNGSLLYVAVSGLPKCPPSVPDAECAKLKRDLQAAARVQQALLPAALPDTPPVRLAWAFRPCEELAGDLLNIFRFDNQGRLVDPSLPP